MGLRLDKIDWTGRTVNAEQPNALDENPLRFAPARSRARTRPDPSGPRLPGPQSSARIVCGSAWRSISSQARIVWLRDRVV